MFGEEIRRRTWDELNAQFSKLEPAAAKRVSSMLVSWLAKTRKMPVSDLDYRLTDMSGRIDKLARALVLKFSDDRVAVTADGENHDTLVLLSYGSSWFVGHPNVEQAIVQTVFSEQ